MNQPKKNTGIAEYLNIAVIFGLLCAYGIAYLFLPVKHVSVIEKRALAKQPVFSAKTLWAGNFTRGLEEYFADHFAWRDNWIAAATTIRDCRGFKPKENIKLVTTVQPEFLPDESLVEDSSEANNEGKDTIKKASHSLFIYDGRAYQIFGGNARVAGIYSSRLNFFQEAIGDSVKFYCMVVPSSAPMSLPDKYLKMGANEKKNITTIYEKLNPEWCTPDAYSEMLKHKGEYLFFGSDHHWTGLGAYYAYRAFAGCAGFDPVAVSMYEKRVKRNFLGTLYALSRDEEIQNNPDSVVYYRIPGKFTVHTNSTSNPEKWVKGALLYEGASGGNSYGVFLGSDFPVIRIVSENKNGRRILVLKESYGNAFVPWIAPHFENIFVADIRYFRFGLQQFIRDNHINEVLVINGIFMANNPYFPNKIKSMVYKSQSPLGANNGAKKDSIKKE